MQEILNDGGKQIFLIFCFVVIIDFIIAFFFYLRGKKLIDSGLTAIATVTDSRVNREGGTEYKVDFKDRLGRKYSGKLFSSYKPIKVGDEVEVLYDKDNPEKVKPNHKFQIFIIPIVLMMSNVLFVGLLSYMVHIGVAKVPF